MVTMAPMGAATNYTPTGSSTVTEHQQPAGLYDAAMVNLARLFQPRPKPVAAAPQFGGAGATTPSYSAPPKSAAQIAEERLRTAKATQAMKLLPMQTEAEALKMQAAASPAPVRATSFASGAINGYTTDPMAMNAYQRELFLPKESSMSGPSLAEQQDAEQSRRDDFYRTQAEEAEARHRMEYQQKPQQKQQPQQQPQQKQGQG